jgi:hypothetical protein
LEGFYGGRIQEVNQFSPLPTQKIQHLLTLA